jgi:hypothetical protein
VLHFRDFPGGISQAGVAKAAEIYPAARRSPGVPPRLTGQGHLRTPAARSNTTWATCGSPPGSHRDARSSTAICPLRSGASWLVEVLPMKNLPGPTRREGSSRRRSSRHRLAPLAGSCGVDGEWRHSLTPTRASRMGLTAQEPLSGCALCVGLGGMIAAWFHLLRRRVGRGLGGGS